MLDRVILPYPNQGQGGGGIVPPPPEGTLPQISQERLELSTWNLLTIYMNSFSKQKSIFQLPAITIGYHSNVQSWCMFLKNTFWQLTPNPEFFCDFHEDCPKWSPLWEIGLYSPLYGVLMKNFVRIPHSFSCFNDLKLDNTITMTPRMVSFDFGLI